MSTDQPMGTWNTGRSNPVDDLRNARTILEKQSPRYGSTEDALAAAGVGAVKWSDLKSFDPIVLTEGYEVLYNGVFIYVTETITDKKTTIFDKSYIEFHIKGLIEATPNGSMTTTVEATLTEMLHFNGCNLGVIQPASIDRWREGVPTKVVVTPTDEPNIYAVEFAINATVTRLSYVETRPANTTGRRRLR